MRIISRGDAGEPKRIVCDSCGSELEYEPIDVYYGSDGSFIDCPVCGKYVCVDKKEEHHIPVYPVDGDNDFYFFEGGLPMTDKEINERIKQMCDEWASLDDGEERNNYVNITGTGDTIIIAVASGEDEHLEIYVCKNYAEAMFWTKE